LEGNSERAEMEESLGTMISNGLAGVEPDGSVQESEWVKASQQGDSPAFNRLVLRWEKPIFNLSLRMLQDQDEAAEATQEVFLAAFRSIRRFRLASKFSTWLYRIAVNQCITRLRRRPPGAHYSLDDETREAPLAARLPSHDSHEREFLKRESQLRVRKALAYLPPDMRAVVELKFFQELTFEQIAAIVETPLSTVKSRLYSGLELLKVRLGGVPLQS
jgi:RNA polymerase sigma-70 factor (ECF subfamily)